MTRTRQVRLVVADSDGDILGVTPYRTTSVPWWQEAAPLRAAFPELFTGADGTGTHAVLRLLEAEHDSDAHMGGRSTHLVQIANRAAVRGSDPLSREQWRGPADVATGLEPLRHPWAKPGGPADDLAWVARQVEVTGDAVQHRTWNLSAIWSVPSSRGTVWLKAVPTFFQHETAVLETLAEVAPDAAPSLIAADGHRQLLVEMDGVDGFRADTDEQIAMVDALVDLQLAAAGETPALLAAGVPDGRSQTLADNLAAFLKRAAPTDRKLQRLATELPERIAKIDALGLPDVLVHGDPHPGNCRLGVKPPTWFDWGDSFIGNPLLDLGAVHRMSPSAVSHWLSRWSEQAGGADLTSAWETLRPVALVRSALVYQQFLDAIEPDEHIYHRDDVALTLDQVRQLLSAE